MFFLASSVRLSRVRAIFSKPCALCGSELQRITVCCSQLECVLFLMHTSFCATKDSESCLIECILYPIERKHTFQQRQKTHSSQHINMIRCCWSKRQRVMFEHKFGMYSLSSIPIEKKKTCFNKDGKHTPLNIDLGFLAPGTTRQRQRVMFEHKFRMYSLSSIPIEKKNVFQQRQETHSNQRISIIRWLRKIIGLFCRISSLLQGSFAKETQHFKEPTNRIPV